MAFLGSGRSFFDLSFAGSEITVDGASIKDFMDDANPIDIQDAEVSNIEWSCNATMIRTVKPSAVMISITVVPGSASDYELHKIWLQSFCNQGGYDENVVDSGIEISIIPGQQWIPRYSFKQCTMVSGAPAVTANGEGKMGGNTYTFACPSTAE